MASTRLPFLALALAWSTTVGCASLNPSKSSQTTGTTGGAGAAPTSFTDKLTSWFKGDKPKTPPKATIDASDSALSLNSKSKPGPEVNVAMAQLAEGNGNFEEAEKQYRKALDLKPKFVPALLGLAHLKDRAGELESATKFYQTATAANPQDARPFNDLGLCYHRRGMLKESAATLQRAIALQPEKKLYRNNLAAVLVDMNQPTLALEQLVMADGKAIGHYNLGYLLMKKGDNSAALAEFTSAAAADPGLEAAQQWIARLSTPAGRQDIQVARQTPLIQQRPAAGPAGNSQIAVMDAPQPLASAAAPGGVGSPPPDNGSASAAPIRTLQYPHQRTEAENPEAVAVAPDPAQSVPVAVAPETGTDPAPPSAATESDPPPPPDLSGPQLGSARRNPLGNAR